MSRGSLYLAWRCFSMDERNSIGRKFPGGYAIYAWLEKEDQEPKFKIQWRKNNKSIHQPFITDLKTAPSVLRLLAEFADTLQKQENS